MGLVALALGFANIDERVRRESISMAPSCLCSPGRRSRPILSCADVRAAQLEDQVEQDDNRKRHVAQPKWS